MKNSLRKILLVASILLVLAWIVFLISDYINAYPFGSAPFYVYVLVRSIGFIIPAIICFLISLFIKKRINS